MENKTWRAAFWAAIVTILYNIIEGVVSVAFGYSDEALSLFGFGMDSFVEVISGIGVLHMVVRSQGTAKQRDRFEKIALRITGSALYLLSAGLCLTAGYNTCHNIHPSTTFWGIIIASVSILTMSVLVKVKKNIGTALHSDALIADANCTKTCIYLSVVLLVASVLYEVLKIGYIDSIGAVGIAVYAFKEGREAFEKARGKSCGCNTGCSV